jgi:hypothetical protein
MQRNLAVIACAVLVLLAGACGKDPEQVTHFGPPPDLLPSSAPSLIPSPTTSATGSAGPSASPTIIGNMTAGGASVITAGGINSTLTLAKLTAPGLWTPPPGDLSLRWAGADGASLSLVGPAFTSRQPTTPTLILSFTVPGSAGAPVQFSSSAGECFVTISAAMPQQMGGIFDCGTLVSSDGKITLSAQGTFSASG